MRDTEQFRPALTLARTLSTDVEPTQQILHTIARSKFQE